ncbi:MAG: hypothetical protein WCI30_00090 [Clostridia bacterium]
MEKLLVFFNIGTIISMLYSLMVVIAEFFWLRHGFRKTQAAKAAQVNSLQLIFLLRFFIMMLSLGAIALLAGVSAMIAAAVIFFCGEIAVIAFFWRH